MKSLVKKVMEDYSNYLKEEAILERHLEMRENSDMRDALTMLKIKLGIVESWFTLLDVSERFVFRQTIQADPNDIPTRCTANMLWIWQLIKTGENPWVLMEQAIEKIAEFVLAHKEIMEAVFGGDWQLNDTEERNSQEE